MWSMSGRPCNPGNDLKRLWQFFLRDTPMPQCAAQQEREEAGSVESAGSPTTEVKSASAAKPAGER